MTACPVPTDAQNAALHAAGLRYAPRWDGMAKITCEADGCDCSFDVVAAKYLALPVEEIGCPKCGGEA